MIPRKKLPIFFPWFRWSKRIEVIDSHDLYHSNEYLILYIESCSRAIVHVTVCTQRVIILLKIPKIISKSRKNYRVCNRLCNGQLITFKMPTESENLKNNSNRASLSSDTALNLTHSHSPHKWLRTMSMKIWNISYGDDMVGSASIARAQARTHTV